MKKILAVIILPIFLFGCSSSPANQPSSALDTSSASSGEIAEAEDPIKAVSEILDVDYATATNVLDEILNCEVAVTRIRRDSNLDSYNDSGGTSYWVITPVTNEVILHMTPESEIHQIRYKKEFIYKDGEMVKPFMSALSGELITLWEYEQIEIGMNYNQVKRIVGGDGILQSAVDLDIGKEYATEMYCWYGLGDNGANAIITFQGGKVATISQFLLT